jgi:hypothetical protein
MNLVREIGKIFAPIAALIAGLLALFEFYQLLNRIKMLADAINFISDKYNSVTSTWNGFFLWKQNATYLMTQPVYNAFPILDIVPGIVWDILKVVILLYVALWFLDHI